MPPAPDGGRAARLAEMRRALWLEATAVANACWAGDRPMTRAEQSQFDHLLAGVGEIDRLLGKKTAGGGPPLRVVMTGD